jgi:hypothetical protein
MDAAKWIDNTFKSMRWRDLMIGFAAVAVCLFAFASFAGNSVLKGDEHSVREELHQTPDFLFGTQDRDNPKSYFPLPPGFDTDRFVIAWVVGSGANIKEAPPEWLYKGESEYRLSEVLADQIKTIDGREVRMDFLALAAASCLDIRRSLLYALNNPEIDAVIVTVNEFLAFNDWRTISRTDRSAILDAPLAQPIDWLALLTIAAPSDVFMRQVQKAAGVYDARRELSGELYAPQKDGFLAAPKARREKAEEPPRYWQNLFFPDSAPNWLGWLSMSDIRRDGFGARVFAANVRDATNSGKPVIFYMQPARDDVKTDPQFRRDLDREIDLIDKLADKYADGRTKVVTWSAIAAPQPYAHRDEYHLMHGQGVVDMLVQLLRDDGLDIELNDISGNYGPGYVPTPAQDHNSEDSGELERKLSKTQSSEHATRKDPS